MQFIHLKNGLARNLATDIYQLRDNAISEEVVQSCTLCVLDFFAVTLAALKEPLSRNITISVNTLRGNAESTMFSTGEQTSAPLAALVNGALAHILDFDDTLWSYIGHSTSVIFSASLAMAEAVNCSGRDLLRAFALGVEAAHRIGSPIIHKLSKRGWHPSPVIGIYGATVAASLIINSDDIDNLTKALTIATTMAAGIRQNFGSNVKPLSIGWASHSGIMASIFAQHGISGSEDALEGRQGFYMAYAGATPEHFYKDKDGKMAIVSPGVGFKLYPSCTGTHPTIDAIISLQKDETIDPDEIISVKIEVTPEVLDELIYPSPSTPSQGKFSLPFCAAIALIYGNVGIEHFQKEYIKDSKIRTLMNRIQVVPNKDLIRMGEENCPASNITITTYSNKKIQKSINVAKGNPGNPLTIEEMKEKFFQCARWVGLSEDKTEEFFQQIISIRSIPSITVWMKSIVAPIFNELSSKNLVKNFK